jgi:adenylate cyclase
LELGIGIHTGPAQVGNSGSSRRLKYGPRGHTVNLASRVESATRHLGGHILLTAATQNQLAGEFVVRRICQARLPGVKEIVTLYELPEQPPADDWVDYCQRAEAALSKFEATDWKAAAKGFEELSSTDRGSRDLAVGRLLNAARKFATEPVTPAEPVIELSTK